MVASRPSGVRCPSSVPRPNSTAWIRVDPTSARISFTSLLVIKSASVKKKMTSGFS